MQTSTNLQMNLPELTDVADITKLTANFSILDTFAGKTVTTDGTQTISGAKTFTGKHELKQNTPYLRMVDTKVTKGTNPTSNSSHNIRFEDTNNYMLSQVGRISYADGDGSTFIQAYNSNGENMAELLVLSRSNGDHYVRCSTPLTDGLNNTVIGNLEYLNNPTKATYLVHRAGKESLTGHKVMSEVSYANGHGILVGYMPASTQGGYKLLTTISLGLYYGVYLDITMGGGAEPLSFKRVHVSRRVNPNRAVAVCIESHTYGADETSVWVKYNDDGTIGLYLPEVSGINTNVYQYAISYGSGYATDGNGYSNICTRVTDTALVHLSALPDGCVEMIHAVDRNPKMVTTDGEQTITGLKTFTDIQYFKPNGASATPIALYNMSYVTSVIPSDNTSSRLAFRDKNGVDTSQIIDRRSKYGDEQHFIRVIKSAGGILDMGIEHNVNYGDRMFGVTPTNNNAPSDTIVTKGYVASTNSSTNNLFHKEGKEWATGEKHFRGAVYQHSNSFMAGGWMKREDDDYQTYYIAGKLIDVGTTITLGTDIFSRTSESTGYYQIKYTIATKTMYFEKKPTDANVGFAILEKDGEYYIGIRAGKNEVVKFEFRFSCYAYLGTPPDTSILDVNNGRAVARDGYTVVCEVSN